MPVPAVLFGTGLVTSTAYPYSIKVGDTEVAPTSAELDTLEFVESGDDSAGTLRARLYDPTLTLTVGEELVVRVQDNVSGAQVFLGFVLRRWAETAAVGRYINIEAVSVSRMLDELIIPREIRQTESDQSRVSYLWGLYARYPLDPDQSLVELTNASIAADDLVGMTLRTALTQTAGLAGDSTQYYIDSLGRLVWRSGNGVSSAPFNINVAQVPGGGNIAPVDLKVTRDGVIKNRYYVRAATEEASGYYQDFDSIGRYGPREDYIDAPSADTPAKANSIARLQLGRTADPNIRAEFSTIDPNSGWRADQMVTITSPADDLTAESLRIAKVTTTFWRGDGKRSYRIEAGKTGGRFSSLTGSSVQVSATPGQNITGTISTPDGSAVISTIDDSQTGGFGPTTRRFIASGVYNGDFNATPVYPDSPVSVDNRLPFWTFAQGSGTAFGALSVDDPLTASGRSIQMTLRSGSAGDEGYLEQIVPVNGSQGRSFVYLAAATFKTGATVNSIELFCRTQYLAEDGVTETGTENDAAFSTTGIGATTLRDIQSGASDAGAVPADAYWLRVQIGVRRGGAATTDTVTVTLHEARLQTGGVQVFVTEGSDPTTYGYASMYQADGALFIAPNQGGAGGFNPDAYLDAEFGNVGLRSANSRGVVLGSSDATQNPYIEMYERTDPASAGTNSARLYVRDNGAGKSQLVVRFGTGAIQVIATEP